MAVFKNAPPNTDAINFIQAAGLTNETQCKAIGTLVFDLKNYGLWDKMRAIYPFVGQPGVSSSFEFNLKDPNTFRGTFISTGWTFSNTGVTPNGAGTFFNTGFNLRSNLSASNSHVSVYARTDIRSLADKDLFGAADGSNYVIFDMYNNTPSALVTIGGSNFINTSFDTGTGLFTLTLTGTGTNQHKIFQNNIQRGSNTNTNTILPNLNLYFSGLNINGSSARTQNLNEIAFGSIGDGLTDTDAANLYTAVQRFQTTLGRQV